jgi:hypothetical protein
LPPAANARALDPSRLPASLRRSLSDGEFFQHEAEGKCGTAQRATLPFALLTGNREQNKKKKDDNGSRSHSRDVYCPPGLPGCGGTCCYFPVRANCLTSMLYCWIL